MVLNLPLSTSQLSQGTARKIVKPAGGAPKIVLSSPTDALLS